MNYLTLWTNKTEYLINKFPYFHLFIYKIIFFVQESLPMDMVAGDGSDRASIRKFIHIFHTSIMSSCRKTFNLPQWNSAKVTDALSENVYPNQVSAMDFWSALMAATNEIVSQSRDNTRLICRYDNINAIYIS